MFNGEKVIDSGFSSEHIKQMYTAAPREMSPELAKFNFSELMLLMDNCYGLKEEHRIRSFLNMVIFNKDLHALLAGTDPKAFDAALTTLLMNLPGRQPQRLHQRVLDEYAHFHRPFLPFQAQEQQCF